MHEPSCLLAVLVAYLCVYFRFIHTGSGLGLSWVFSLPDILSPMRSGSGLGALSSGAIASARSPGGSVPGSVGTFKVAEVAKVTEPSGAVDFASRHACA